MQINFSVPFALASIYSTSSGAGQGKTTQIFHTFLKVLDLTFFFLKKKNITFFFFLIMLQKFQVYLWESSILQSSFHRLILIYSHRCRYILVINISLFLLFINLLSCLQTYTCSTFSF